MVFHIYIDILHFLRVYYELTLWPAPRWLDSSVGRTLHPYRRGHRFESRSGLKIFFRLWFHNCLSCVYNCDDQLKIHIFLSSSGIWYFIYTLTFFTFYGYIMNSQCDQLPDDLIAQSVEHCIGIAEVIGSNPVRAWKFFSGFGFTTA